MGNQLLGRFRQDRSGGFTQEQASYLEEKFSQICDQNGFIVPEKAKMIYQTTDNIVSEVLKMMDFDDSGPSAIDFYKFKCFCALMCQGTSQDTAEQLYQIFDIGEGTEGTQLQHQEIRDIAQTAENYLAFLNDEKERTNEEIDERTSQLIRKWDFEKKDGLNKEQFQKMLTKDPLIKEWMYQMGMMSRTEYDPQDADFDDADDDLEAELDIRNKPLDMRIQKIQEGVQHVSQHQANDPDMIAILEKAGRKPGQKAPWVDSVVPPKGYKPKKTPPSAPPANLEIQYVYGYRCFDTRNNIKYGPSNEIVYHASAIGIVTDSKSLTQQFYMDHTDDITCIDVSDNLVATGQVGEIPLITVWDLTTMESILVLKGDLTKGIGQIAISHSGQYIAATALDQEQTIAVYDVQVAKQARKNPKATNKGLYGVPTKTCKAPILAMEFAESEQVIMLACMKEVVFLTLEFQVIKAFKGQWGDNPVQAALSLAFIHDLPVTGMFNGSLFVWKDFQINKIEKAHKKPITALCTRQGNVGIISGGQDGMIKFWDNNLVCQSHIEIDNIRLKEAPINRYRVTSLIESPKGKNLLIGLGGGQIVELAGGNQRNPRLITSGHYGEDVWGLSCHPSKLQFVTSGSENMIFLWDLTSHQCLKNYQAEYPLTIIEYSPNGKRIAAATKYGIVYILNEKLELEKELDDETEPDKDIIGTLKFSPQSDVLAVTYNPPHNHILIFDANNFKLIRKINGPTTNIVCMDFSVDGNTLLTNQADQTIHIYNVKDGKEEQIEKFRDEKWATWTCTMGWPVIGIWPECSLGPDLNTVDRSRDGTLIATGDDYSQVRLFRYPCPKAGASFNQASGHSSQVGCVRFSFDGQYLISIGTEEKTIIQWKVQKTTENAQDAIEGDEEQVPESEKKAAGGQDDGLFGAQEVDKGDQAGAVKPFLGELKASIPSWFKENQKRDNVKPDGEISLHYAHGYRFFYQLDDCRDMVKYTDKDQFITAGGSVGIQQEKQPGGKQTFFVKHEEDVISLDIHPLRNIAATGQMAMKGKKTIDMHVWDIDKMQSICLLNDFHRRGITNIKFSVDGTLLLSIGQDDDNSLAIYEWQQKRLVVTSPVDKAKVTSCCWKNDNKQFVTTGMKHVKVWALNGRNVKGTNCNLEGEFVTQFTSTYAFKFSTLVTGGGNGKLAIWNGNQGKPIEAHQGKVSSLYANDETDTLFSGAFDGQVIAWSKSGGSLVKQSVYADLSVAVADQVPPGVLSIDMNQKKEMLLGTLGAQVWEVPKPDGKANLLLQGHYDATPYRTGELWGLAVHNSQNEFISSGSDYRVRKWNIEDGIQTAMSEPFEEDIRAVDWSPKGDVIIAVDQNAIVYLLDAEQLKVIDKLATQISKLNPNSKEQKWVEDIKFNPEGTKAAFGAHGCLSPINVIFLKDKTIEQDITLDMGFSSAILHLDWSKDGEYIVANSQAYELKFCGANSDQDIKGGKAPVKSSSMKDTEWASWTCQLGFPVQGVFQGVDYTDVNSCVRSNSNKYLATGNDDSMIRLFKYPVVVEKQVHKQFKGHSSHITKVRFTYSDNYLVSTGGMDQMVMVWQTTFGGVEESKNAGGNKQLLASSSELVVPKAKVKAKDKGLKGDKSTKAEGDLFAEEAKDAGDQFMAVQPWVGAIKEPSQPYFKDPKQSDPPPVNCTLQYVHGFRAKDQRNNLRWLTDQTIVYNAAAVGIVHDISNNTQKHFLMHADDILSLDVHPNNKWVATGELGPKPNIFVWNSEDMAVVHQFPIVVKKGVCCLAFSPSGDQLLCAAIDDEHFIGVMDLKTKGTKSFKGDKSVILDLDWKNETQFVTIGPKLYKVWVEGGADYTAQKGDPQGQNEFHAGCAFASPSECFVGAANGDVQVWNGTSITRTLKALHEKACEVVMIHENCIITGGRDGRVCFLNKKSPYDAITSFNVDAVIPPAHQSFNKGVRSLHLNSAQTQILVGTLGSEIYELDLKPAGSIKSTTQFTFQQKHMQGHYAPSPEWTNEVWGLTAYPNDEDRFATCSDDGSLRLWSRVKRVLVSSQYLYVNLVENVKDEATQLRNARDPQSGDILDSYKGRAIAISPDGNTIVVGCKDGFIRIFDSELNQIKEFQHAQRWVSDIQFSPDGSVVVVGAHDQTIYAYNVATWKPLCKPMKQHSSAITHIDFSQDGNSLHSTCQAYELLFWDVNSGKQLPSGATNFKDEQWASWTVTLGWPVQGIWPECADGTDINAVDRSPATLNGQPDDKDYYLLALGDDFGKVRIMRYPSIKKSSKAIEQNGHSSHVTTVRWNNTNNYIYSTGGEDQTVMVWKVEKK